MELRLLCVLAHPDDESLGTGGILAKYSREGVETFVVTATRGERGRFDDKGTSPGPLIVGQTREAELRAAARELGVREVSLLDYLDGELDQADAGEATDKIAGHIRRLRPQVVVTFDPFGAYGHPDHIAISQLTSAAIVRAAAEHRVSKFYYFVNGERKWAAYQAAFKTLTSKVDGCVRAAFAWPDWSITAKVDARQVW
jgi:LmbE family N-acetylglucosaminyl deacetylase